LFAEKSIDDITLLRRETNLPFTFFSEFGDVVDLNLDYFPELIAVTFSKHQDVVKTLAKKEVTYTTTLSKSWVFNISKITFKLPVRNCSVADEAPPNKYLPLYLQKEKREIFTAGPSQNVNSSPQKNYPACFLILLKHLHLKRLMVFRQQENYKPYIITQK